MSQSHSRLEQILETQIQTLNLTLPPSTVGYYRYLAHGFLRYLHTTFRSSAGFPNCAATPHLLGWFRWMWAHQPPLSNQTRIDYLVRLRRLLDDLAANGHPLPPDLIRPRGLPAKISARFSPSPLSAQTASSRRRSTFTAGTGRTADLPANALLLTRATGIRIGECIRLPLDGLRQLGSDQWALHVPLGKLHTERLVPADAEVRLVARIHALRALAPPAHLAHSEGFLLPRSTGPTRSFLL
jgi:hypothetical protein